MVHCGGQAQEPARAEATPVLEHQCKKQTECHMKGTDTQSTSKDKTKNKTKTSGCRQPKVQRQVEKRRWCGVEVLVDKETSFEEIKLQQKM